MNAPEEGVEQLDVRTMWPHEALSFTPWLAKSLHLLGAELGLKLELIQQRSRSFRCSSTSWRKNPTPAHWSSSRTSWNGPILTISATAHLRHLP